MKKLTINEIDNLQVETGEALKILIENHYEKLHHIKIENVGLNTEDKRFICIKVYVTEKNYRAVKLEFNTLKNGAKELKNYFTKFHDALVCDNCEIYIQEQEKVKINNQYLN